MLHIWILHFQWMPHFLFLLVSIYLTQSVRNAHFSIHSVPILNQINHSSLCINIEHAIPMLCMIMFSFLTKPDLGCTCSGVPAGGLVSAPLLHTWLHSPDHHLQRHPAPAQPCPCLLSHGQLAIRQSAALKRVIHTHSSTILYFRIFFVLYHIWCII